MPFDLLASRNYINEISIYENAKHYYFIGKHFAHKTNLIFTIKKENFQRHQRGTSALKDLLEEHKREYDDKALEELFRKLAHDPHTRLKKIEEAKCLFGFVKFYFNYYAILVIEYSKIGKIGEYVINRAEKLKMLPLFTIDHKTSYYLELENKYLTVFKNFEISRQTYFSYNYNLTKTLQRNFVEKIKGELIKNYNKNFCSNVLIDSERNVVLNKDYEEANYFNKDVPPFLHKNSFGAVKGNLNESGLNSYNERYEKSPNNTLICQNNNANNNSNFHKTDFNDTANNINIGNTSLNHEIFNLNNNMILNTNNLNNIANLNSNSNNVNQNPNNMNNPNGASIHNSQSALNGILINNNKNSNNNLSNYCNNNDKSNSTLNQNQAIAANNLANYNVNINPQYKSSSSSLHTYVKKTSNIKKLTQNIFLWNHFHIKEFFNIMENKIWCTWFIYGFFDQVECLIYGQRFLVTVIARRNRKYAGTRYLKRGINDEGEVANDVETEQILEEISTSCPEKPIISSYVHIRGSVPIYWYQEQNGILPKPDIKVNYTDIFYESTKKHFMKLIERYGEPTIVCNLTKKKEEHKQELLLNESYENSVEYILAKLKEDEEKKTKFINLMKSLNYGFIDDEITSKNKIKSLYSEAAANQGDSQSSSASEKQLKRLASGGSAVDSPKIKKKVICFKNEKIKSDINEFNKFLSHNFNYKNLDLFSNLHKKQNRVDLSSNSKSNRENKYSNNNDENTSNPRKHDFDNQNNVINILKDIDEKIGNKIIYCHYDLKQERRNLWFYYNFYLIAYNFTEITNMFTFIPHLRCSGSFLLELQKGIIRSNCVDCLDRTNVFQQVIGTAVMVSQLRSMGLDVKEPNNEDDEIFGALTELYKKMGNTISNQYAGSLAHKQTIKDTRTKINKFIDKIPEILNTCKRYFNNSFNDQYKQSTINLFLGKFRNFPDSEMSDEVNKHLWDLPTDHFMHKSKKKKEVPSDWVNKASKTYETYSLINDLFDKYQCYKKHKVYYHSESKREIDPEYTNEFALEADKPNFNINIQRRSYPRNRSLYLKSKEVNAHEDEKEGEFTLKKDIIDLIEINLHQNYENKYIIDLSRYNNKVKKSNPEFITYGLLDIDPKINIKAYQNFNYTKLYNRYLSEESENEFLRSTNKSFSQTNGFNAKQGTKEYLFSSAENKKISDIILNESENSTSKKKLREKEKPRNLKEPATIGYTNEYKVSEPKYNLKFTFDFDENDVNLIREYIEPDIKFRGSEYEEKDEFLKMEINKENFLKLFNQDFTEEPALAKAYYENNCSEFKDDLKIMLSNTNPKKVQKKQKNNKDKDYLIFDVSKSVFYKKIQVMNNNANQTMINDSYNNNFNSTHNVIGNGNGNFNNHFSKTSTNSVGNLFFDSPKMVVKVNRIPLNLIEDYII